MDRSRHGQGNNGWGRLTLLVLDVDGGGPKGWFPHVLFHGPHLQPPRKALLVGVTIVMIVVQGKMLVYIGCSIGLVVVVVGRDCKHFAGLFHHVRKDIVLFVGLRSY